MANKTYLSITNFIKSKQENIKYVQDFVIFVLMYGFLSTLSLSVILPSRVKFNVQFILALGIMFYFIKEELPAAIKKLK